MSHYDIDTVCPKCGTFVSIHPCATDRDPTCENCREKKMKFIALEDLVVGKCYELKARNLPIGIWDGKEFHGIRYKWADKFMDTEIHYDLDDRYGTAQAIRELK